MSDIFNIADFLEPVNRAVLSQDESYKDGQMGKTLLVYEEEMPDLTMVDIILVGCGETRGRVFLHPNNWRPIGFGPSFINSFSGTRTFP
ncbi:hypothetical protein [Paraflavitalea speifideaquila]|uniref:hypothetical protein n=1 Tax=Paraflavitalea speifideaquila TaxID=3076558 RepID=UPI0028E7077E|nr:hypothetical protein [Paraflavitalea speifideiaquila]